MDSAGMSLEEVLAKHLLPRLDATKTACLKYRGQITQKFQAPDWNARLEALKLALELRGGYPEK